MRQYSGYGNPDLSMGIYSKTSQWMLDYGMAPILYIDFSLHIRFQLFTLVSLWQICILINTATIEEDWGYLNTVSCLAQQLSY